MSYADTFLNIYIRQRLLTMHTAMPAKIVSYDEAQGRATIQPLFMTKEYGKPPEPLPVVENVPVLKHRLRTEGGIVQEYTPVYEKDDVVFVAFAERALDAVLADPGRVVLPSDTRHHSLNDAVILGALMT